MAHLDTLIAMIPDEKLRTEIQSQVSKLTAKTSFGLVFEEHLPETVQLPGFEIARGGKVVFKDGSNPGIWTVLRVADGTATMVRPGDGKDRVTAKVDELVVIREFGDPIYPGLKSVGSVVRGGDKPFHTVINAENYHATEMLLYPYEGKVGAIYLDPPYNTGAKDWKYNNDYVDDKDQYRHSKWLSFIEKRLRLAKRLLNPKDSVLIFTIDEKEYLRAGLLLEQIFPSAKITMTSVVINPKGVPRSGFARVDEYIFFVALGSAAPSVYTDSFLGKEPRTNSRSVRWRGLTRTGSNGTRAKSPGAFFPIFIDIETGYIHSAGRALSQDQKPADIDVPQGTVAVWPTPRPDGTEGRWSVVDETFDELLRIGAVKTGKVSVETNTFPLWYLTSENLASIESGQIEVIGREPSGAMKVAYAEEGAKKTAPRTVWHRASHSASEHGSGLLQLILPNRSFPYPKSLYAVEDTLRLFVGDKPDALVLDFFGGSGTTAHAVMKLNHLDAGRRQSIVVTNNAVSDEEDEGLRKQGHEPGDADYEALGIFEYITRPRITSAVTGNTPEGKPIEGEYRFSDEFQMSDGFEENVEFFKLTYEDNQLVRLGRKFEAIAPILWMRAGAEGERIDALPADGWALPKKGFYGVLTDIDQWEPFVDAVNARDDVRCVYIVTDSQAEFEAINVQIDQGIDSVRLYSDYLQSFEINTRQG